ncbi:membrane protein [Betaproteobacteria bacterium]|nr:membrane protein [Betaproteobacteria bacterium]
MDRVVIIADDFTGACDTGVHFACGGVRTAFAFDNEAIPHVFDSCNALALSTGTRHLPAQDAAEAVYESTSLCQQAGGTFFYKKVDSALRGNPGSETEAVLQGLKISAALICPALPASGRSVVKGNLLVNGAPLHETSLGQDVFTPVDTSSVAGRFTRHSGLRAGRVEIDDLKRGREHLVRRLSSLLDAGCTAIIADAVSNAHLATLSDILMYSHDPKSDLPHLLPVGSAGLGRSLAKAFSGTVIRETIRPHGRLLAVVGSLNDSALEQVNFAVTNNQYALLSFNLENALINPEQECEALLRAVAGTEGPVLLHGKGQEKKSGIRPESGIRVANVYGRLVMGLCRKLPFSTVFATGGDTAISVAGHLGLDSMMLEEELLPGIALSSCFSKNTNVRWFISKAGSFGDRETLVSIAETLNR